MRSRLTHEIASLAALCLLVSFAGSMVSIEKAKANSYHDPIVIDGDANFTYANGVVRGIGTVEDPYVIEGWDISSLGTTGAAIHVNNTMASFVIRDVSVSSTGIGDGIVLENLVNGTVEDVTVLNCGRGITLLDANDSAVVGCGVYDSLNEGIWLADTANITVQSCILDNNSYGIRDNLLDRILGYPKVFFDNDFIGNGYGIRTSTSYALVMNNTFSMNDVGLWCLGGWATTTGNLFSDSTSFAIEIVAGAPSNNIMNNTFFGNNGAGVVYDPSHIQAYDDGTNTNWDIGGFGNYWSDWQSPDDNHDGIVDIPYDLADNPMHMVAGSDHYPLTTPPVISEFALMPFVTVVFLAVFVLAVSLRRRDG
jgi:nitrous oxidase accessory protein NosD